MSQLPRTWGPGQLFAFSGMDGPTCATSPMVAHTLAERLGLRVFFEPPVEIWCQAHRPDDPTRKYPRCMPEYEIICGDAIRLTARFMDGETVRIAWAPLAQDVIAGYTHRRIAPHWSVGPNAHQPLDEGTTVHHADEGTLALVVRAEGDRLHFALGFDPDAESAAITKAREGTQADLDGLIDTRIAWIDGIELPANLPPAFEPTYRKAVCNMRVNTCTPEGQIKHRWTTPDRWPHRWMWLHDSAYHAAGHVYVFPDLAAEMLRAVFDTQYDDGRIALFMRPDGNFPDISQSPVLTWAAERVFEATRDTEWLEDIAPRLSAYLDYFVQTRKFQDTGLYRWAHSDESMDNNPRFDHGADFGAIDLSATLCREFEAMQTLSDALGRSEDAEKWGSLHDAAAEAINAHLWHEASGDYADLMPDGMLKPHDSNVGFLALFAGIVPADRAERLRRNLSDPARFATRMPVPSVARNSPLYYPDMWRGPSWLNINYLILEGLERYDFKTEAARLRQRCLDIVHAWCAHTGCIYEFYDADDVIPPYALDRKSRMLYAGGFPNISDYHWSSALFVAMCHDHAWTT